MAQDINCVVLAGRLTRDAETRSVNDKKIFAFSVASNYYKKSSNGTEANFFDVELWANSDALGQCLKKGCQVVISGELRHERWTDKDGQARSRVKILARELQLVGGKRDSNADAAQGQDDDYTPF